MTLQNKGTVRLDYNWQVVMDEPTSPSRSVTFAAETGAGSRAGSITPSIIGDLASHVPFSIEPAAGFILPGKSTEIKVSIERGLIEQLDLLLIMWIRRDWLFYL